jgi:ribosomal protein L14
MVEQKRVVTKVKPYKRRNKFGEFYVVKAHQRKRRPKGKKVHFSKVGTFFVAHDELGNFRGSKVVTFKKKPKVKKKRFATSGDLEDKYMRGEISYAELVSKKKNELNLL